jgi:hypothetical protein
MVFFGLSWGYFKLNIEHKILANLLLFVILLYLCVAVLITMDIYKKMTKLRKH